MPILLSSLVSLSTSSADDEVPNIEKLANKKLEDTSTIDYNKYSKRVKRFRDLQKENTIPDLRIKAKTANGEYELNAFRVIAELDSKAEALLAINKKPFLVIDTNGNGELIQEAGPWRGAFIPTRTPAIPMPLEKKHFALLAEKILKEKSLDKDLNILWRARVIKRENIPVNGRFYYQSFGAQSNLQASEFAKLKQMQTTDFSPETHRKDFNHIGDTDLHGIFSDFYAATPKNETSLLFFKLEDKNYFLDLDQLLYSVWGKENPAQELQSILESVLTNIDKVNKNDQQGKQ